MAKFVKALFFFLFAIALYCVVDDAFVSETEHQSCAVVSVIHPQESAVDCLQLPSFPDAEIVGGYLAMQQVTMLRIQRVLMMEYSLFQKGLMQGLVHRESVLSQHLGRIYDTTTSYHSHPASRYYVFTLRRIII